MSYQDLIAIGIGRFGLSLLDSKRCTPADFKLYMLAHRIKKQEITEELALQSWFNQSVQAVKKKGKEHVPKFESFDEFYDYETEFYRIFDEGYKKRSNKQPTLADLNRRINNMEKG